MVFSFVLPSLRISCCFFPIQTFRNGNGDQIKSNNLPYCVEGEEISETQKILGVDVIFHCSSIPFQNFVSIITTEKAITVNGIKSATQSAWYKKRPVKKATFSLIFVGKFVILFFFRFWVIFQIDVAFFTGCRFFYCATFFTGVFAFFTGLPKTLCRSGFSLLVCSLSNFKIFCIHYSRNTRTN